MRRRNQAINVIIFTGIGEEVIRKTRACNRRKEPVGKSEILRVRPVIRYIRLE